MGETEESAEAVAPLYRRGRALRRNVSGDRSPAASHAYYNRIADEIVTEVRQKLPQEFLETIDRFEATFGVGRRQS